MSRRAKLCWLLSLLVLLISMVLVGGVTRLTKSGLSITEWKPVTGLLPPLDEASWQREFNLYRESPEFKHQNSHFLLEDYKGIFWWEYIHRVLGRVIFLVASVMSFVFWRKAQWSGSRALVLPLLIAFQGLIGWLMVKTGLHQRPSVSHYMLTLHFLLALLTLTVVYHSLAKMKKPIFVSLSRVGRHLIWMMGLSLLLQIVYGCFTAGLKAGLYFNTFPLMNGVLLPDQAWDYEPWRRNWFENPVLVQWFHRWLGILVGVFVPLGGVWLIKRESSEFLRPVLHLVSVVLVQVVLGIANILLFVPTWLAVVHQFMALLIWLGFCNIVFRMRLTSLCGAGEFQTKRTR